MRKIAFAIALLVIAAVSVRAHAQTYTDLYNFGSNSGDPLQPEAPGVIAQGRDGNLYSTTTDGGANNDGAVFKITPEGRLTVLHSFAGPEGLGPVGGLTLGSDGNLYGTASQGGSGDACTDGCGTVFKITSRGKLTVLYNFTGGTDGEYPLAPPIQGTDGNFYGTTAGTGNFNQYGTIYKLTPSGVLTTLYGLSRGSGTYPIAPLVQGTDGNFYGSTNGPERGTIFKITPKGKFTVIHHMQEATGFEVYSALVQGSDESLYGVTSGGGNGQGRLGTIFKVTTSGTYTALYDFDSHGNSGGIGLAGLVQCTDGNFYGVADVGGPDDGVGTLYRISSQGDFAVLYNFVPVTGEYPQVTLLGHTSGILYGDTIEGGIVSDCKANGCGVFYSFDAGLGPFVSLVTDAGKVGKTIGILGQGFTGASAVSFNGTAANFTVESDTFLKATIPPGAITGYVTVTTPSGTLTSNKEFRVKP